MNKRQTLAKIKRCMRLFDRTVPHWRMLVDIDSVDLGSDWNCPSGQIFGSYENALEFLGLDDADAENLGLYITDKHPDFFPEEYEELTKLWKEVLSS